VQELEEDLEMTETKFNVAMQKYEKVLSFPYNIILLKEQFHEIFEPRFFHQLPPSMRLRLEFPFLL
jgi:hypothetical protein